MTVELVLPVRADIAESPIWDDATGDLLWVDILAGLVHRFDPQSGVDCSVAAGQPVGAVALRDDGDLLLAVRDGFAVLSAEGVLRHLVEVEVAKPASRMNDGACDAAGRYWAGTTDVGRRPGAGSLYRLEAPAGVTRMLSEATLPNGIDWSPDGATMYFVDSATGFVDAFDFDLALGTFCRRRHLIEISTELGMPDGLTVDADGFLWVALYRGWAVHRYSPTGNLDRRIELPVALVTSIAFGDEDMGSLYVTTASRGLDETALQEQRGAGGIFRVRPGVCGLAPHRFRSGGSPSGLPACVN